MPLLLGLVAAALAYAYFSRQTTDGSALPPLALTSADSGKSFVVRAGQQIQLLVPLAPQGQAWAARAESTDAGKPESAIQQMNNTDLPNGVSLNFYARKVGTAIVGGTLLAADGTVKAAIGMTVTVLP